MLAGAVRLLDLGLFRVGGEAYAEENGSFGLTTLHKQHVTIAGASLRFDYPAKSGIERLQMVHDRRCAALLNQLKRRRGGGSELLAYRDGRRWRDVHADDVNAYLQAVLDEEFSAKDFRTWNATVIAAAARAASAHVRLSNGRTTKTGRERDRREIERAVLDLLPTARW
jgi:DNA topoisomerase IB